MAENKLYDKGIKVAGSFSAPGAFPLDSKYVVDTIAQRDDHITKNRSYEGMLVYVKENQTTYQLLKTGWKELLKTNIQYDPVEPGTYIEAQYVIEDDTHRFVTDTQIMTWDSGANIEIDPVTQQQDGLMSKEDKIKLDGIAENATNYTHPNTHPASMIVEDSTHRFATDTEKQYWNGKSSIEVSDSEPENDDVKIWVDNSNNIINEEFSVPEIKDNETNTTDTWSSNKISQEITNALNNIPSFVTITQEDYENLQNKSNSTIYIII